MTRAPYDAVAEHFHAQRTTLQPKEEEYLALLLDPLPVAARFSISAAARGGPSPSTSCRAGIAS